MSRWPALPETAFISLDVIGDQAASWRNHTYLEKRGLNVLPVITADAGPKDMDRALESAWCCFGGFGAVPQGPERRQRMIYLLDTRFAAVMKYAERHGKMGCESLSGLLRGLELVDAANSVRLLSLAGAQA
jgi:hypothetical protein